MSKLYIIILAYNEIANIASVIEEWYSIVKQYGNSESKLVIVDNGNKDETYRIKSEILNIKDMKI